MVEVAISGRGQFKGAETDVIKRFVVDTEGFVGVLNQLVNGEGCIVRFHNSIGHLYQHQTTNTQLYILIKQLSHSQIKFYPTSQFRPHTHKCNQKSTN